MRFRLTRSLSLLTHSRQTNLCERVCFCFCATSDSAAQCSALTVQVANGCQYVIDARTEMWRQQQQQQRNNTNAASIWQKVAFFENCQQDDGTTNTAATIGVY